MKHIKLAVITALFAMTAGLRSCDLEEYNPSGATSEVVFSTPEGINALANSIYYNYRWKYYGREDPVLYMEGGTDLWNNFNLTSYGNQLTQYVNLDWDRGQLRTLWERQYDVINLCNTGINRIVSVEYQNPDEKRFREGEFRFIRAYSYWWLVEFFGDVVMRTEETNTPELYAYRTPAATIYDEVIIPDLKAACELLAIEPIDGMTGRVTKKAAYGALARIALTRAAYGDEAKHYEMALEAANYIINNKSALGVDLYDNYADIFDPANNKNNKEALYVVTYSTVSAYNPDSNPNRLFRYFNPAYMDLCGMTQDVKYGNSPNKNGSSTMSMMPTRHLLTLFSEGDLRYDASFLEEYPLNRSSWTWDEENVGIFRKPASFIGNVTINAGETALLYTRKVYTQAEKDAAPYAIVDLDMTYAPETGAIRSDDNQWARFFPRLTKYDDFSRSSATAPSSNDVIVIRLGEIYLVAAEATAMLGRSGAASYINDLRQRAIRQGYESRMRVDDSDITIDFILDERARELCGEHIRWFDLKRTGKLLEYVNRYNPNITAIRDYHILRPIPQQFLQSILNAAEFGQNEGYTGPGSE
ncbi:MAG: RagB/SusD family nutrient uptake outer membrane protein [Mediterranea sp.]|jgi:hypothetical protein|nr:RagB/SusD family nutrient uptake outer membrane protein [Mediterranea sp.]